MPGPPTAPLEHVDVLIVGAGLSGVGAACHLQRECPTKTFAILEARGATGGTWDLFRYPGVRSDSDMFTLGYSFAPWEGPRAIADGPAILDYIRRTAAEHGLDRHIRRHHRVVHASWSSTDQRWTVEVARRDADVGPETRARLTCGFLFGNTGYYRYDEGFTPEFTGLEHFTGRVVHPQHWPEDLDPRGQRIVVIGSGATAVTLVPALARQGARVTMVQRSPSYVASVPARDVLAERARRALPPKLAYALVRLKNVTLTTALYQLSRRAPGLMTHALLQGVAKALPPGYDVATHFTPHYRPWDQRLCLVPDGDLFAALRDGGAAVVTGQIETFTATGLRLTTGEELAADTVVTATGLALQMFGGMTLDLDGRPVDPADGVAYKGVLLCGVPNLAFTLGYTNASWTLKADLAARYVCRLLRYMDRHGVGAATPRRPDPTLPTEPFLNLTAGYIERAAHVLPRQAARRPWRVPHNYPLDLLQLRHGGLTGHMDFTRRVVPDRPAAGPAAVRPAVAATI